MVRPLYKANIIQFNKFSDRNKNPDNWDFPIKGPFIWYIRYVHFVKIINGL